MSQEVPGRGLGAPQARLVGAVVGWGRGEGAPRLAWHGCLDSDSLLVCVGVHIVSACA